MRIVLTILILCGFALGLVILRIYWEDRGGPRFDDARDRRARERALQRIRRGR